MHLAHWLVLIYVDNMISYIISTENVWNEITVSADLQFTPLHPWQARSLVQAETFSLLQFPGSSMHFSYSQLPGQQHQGCS